MFNRRQSLVAVLGSVLMVLAVLFPPVCFDGSLIPIIGYVFLGKYFQIRNAFGRSVDIVWLIWIIHLSTIGMATLASLLDFGREQPSARTNSFWPCMLAAVIVASVPLLASRRSLSFVPHFFP